MVAAAENGVIGRNNDLPWHLPKDLKYFRQTTRGFPVIMGRKCYDSIGRPLPGRKNIILTRNTELLIPGCVVVHSMAEAYQSALESAKDKVFILGGGEIYRKTMESWDELYLTMIHAEVEGDVFFEFPDFSQWELTKDEPHPIDDKHEYAYSFRVYRRRLRP